MENQIEIYKSPDGAAQVQVTFEEETFWLTQSQIAMLFERERTVITKHLKNIFKEEELDEKVVCANFAHTTQHGAIKGKTQEKEVKYYNLDAILSAGYRVNSKRGTQFRQWATQRLKEYLVQGYVINAYWRKLKQRLKEEGNETVTNCHGLKMLAPDGKMRLTDVADTEQLFRLIQSIPSPKAEPFKLWLAQVAAERLDEMQDPEHTIDRALEQYLQLRYSEN